MDRQMNHKIRLRRHTSDILMHTPNGWQIAGRTLGIASFFIVSLAKNDPISGVISGLVWWGILEFIGFQVGLSASVQATQREKGISGVSISDAAALLKKRIDANTKKWFDVGYENGLKWASTEATRNEIEAIVAAVSSGNVYSAIESSTPDHAAGAADARIDLDDWDGSEDASGLFDAVTEDEDNGGSDLV